MQAIHIWGNTPGRAPRAAQGYPLLHHAQTLQQVEALGLTEGAKRKLLRDNAARIVGLDGAGTR